MFSSVLDDRDMLTRSKDVIKGGERTLWPCVSYSTPEEDLRRKEYLAREIRLLLGYRSTPLEVSLVERCLRDHDVAIQTLPKNANVDSA